MDILVQRAKVQLMLNRPFYGSLVARLQLRDWDGDTFATDGLNLFVPKEHKFDKTELEFVIAHETLHCAFLHMFRRGTRDPMRWNYACDIVINYMLEQDGFKRPKDCLYDSNLAKLSTEKVYDKLPEGQQMPKWLQDLIEGVCGQGDEEGGKGSSKMDPQEIAQRWREALANAVTLGRGSISAEMKELIDSFIAPKIPWTQVLFRYLQQVKGQQDFTSYPFNRAHIWRGMFLPSLQGETIEVVVACDTSGSMSQQEISKSLSEVRGLCENYNDYTIYLMFCDAKIHNVFEITSDTEIPDFVVGRGGTSFVPVFEKMHEMELDHLPLIFFTDLDGEFPKEKKNDTFWVTPNRSRKHSFPFGERIEME